MLEGKDNLLSYALSILSITALCTDKKEKNIKGTLEGSGCKVMYD
jgi:hypothetical protein